MDEDVVMDCIEELRYSPYQRLRCNLDQCTLLSAIYHHGPIYLV